MSSVQAAAERLCDPVAEVSAHYLIARDGTVLSLVTEDMRAWHAGAGSWCGQDDINSRSIGIELDNNGHAPFAAPLMNSLETLLPDIMARWGIQPVGVIGHSDMAPGRKIDPGPHFDWVRLEKLGLAGRRRVHCDQSDIGETAFRKAAEMAGYTADVDHQDLLDAVRLRCRPWARGPLDQADFAAISGTASLR